MRRNVRIALGAILILMLAACEPIGPTNPKPIQGTPHGLESLTPRIVEDIQPPEIRNVSIDGWGPGAAGNSIQFVYNPFGVTKGQTLLRALKRGSTVTNKQLIHDYGIGGQAWLVLHLTNGHSLKVEEAGLVDKRGIRPASNIFWVSFENQSSGKYIEDASSLTEQIYSTLLQASTQTLSQQPKWFTNLSDNSVGMRVDGNHNETWLQNHSLPLIHFTSSDVIEALKNDVVVERDSVNFGKVYGYRSHWRTNSLSLMLRLPDGSTLHIIGPFTTIQRNRDEKTTPVFKVTYASETTMTSVFVKDVTRKLTRYWNQLGINE